MERKKYPADKQMLMDVGNYEVYNRDLVRKVFPRIISEIKAYKPRAKAGDVISLYFVLLTNINGRETLENGEPNPRYEACFYGQSELSRMSGIGINRIPTYVEVLYRNGILSDVKHVWEGTDRYIYYYPSFCPSITEDGFIVDNNGEMICPYYDDICDKL